MASSQSSDISSPAPTWYLALNIGHLFGHSYDYFMECIDCTPTAVRIGIVGATAKVLFLYIFWTIDQTLRDAWRYRVFFPFFWFLSGILVGLYAVVLAVIRGGTFNYEGHVLLLMFLGTTTEISLIIYLGLLLVISFLEVFSKNLMSLLRRWIFVFVILACGTLVIENSDVIYDFFHESIRSAIPGHDEIWLQQTTSWTVSLSKSKSQMVI